MSSSESVSPIAHVLQLVDHCAEELRLILDEMPGVVVEHPSAPSSPLRSYPVIVDVPIKKPSIIAPSVHDPDEVRVSPASSISSKPASRGSSTSVSKSASMTGIMREFNTKKGSRRLYRSLDKKHLLVVQMMDLDEPMEDDIANLLERQLKSSQSESSITDFVPTEPKDYKFTRL